MEYYDLDPDISIGDVQTIYEALNEEDGAETTIVVCNDGCPTLVQETR
jgi:hypothetical protein